MRATISLDSLWQTIQSLSLNNQEWTEYISKEEILAGIDAGLKDLKAGRMIPAEELLKELRHGM